MNNAHSTLSCCSSAINFDSLTSCSPRWLELLAFDRILKVQRDAAAVEEKEMQKQEAKVEWRNDLIKLIDKNSAEAAMFTSHSTWLIIPLPACCYNPSLQA